MREMFPAGKPVSGNMLIGREELLQELETVLGIGQSVVLVAPRRYGKTSVALEILKRFKEKGYFVGELDMFEVTDKKHLAEKLIESCMKNNSVSLSKYWQKLKNGTLDILSMLKFKPADEDLDLILQLGRPSVDVEKLLDDALDFSEKFCKRHKKRMIIFIDEFQETMKIGGELLLKKMRAKFQRQNNVTYLFAGSQESLMTELFQHKQHAFYRFGRLFDVGLISKKDFSPYIFKSFANEGIEISKDSIDLIFDITAGHPFYTQLLCQVLYVDCLKNKKIVIEKSNVHFAEQLVVDHETPLFDEIWKEFGNKKFARNVVNLIVSGSNPYADLGTSKENISRILTDLVRFGYLSKSASGKNIKYDLKDNFFKKYILSKNP